MTDDRYEADFHCPVCNKDGVATGQLETTTLIRCPDCGYEALDVWCDKCGMGGYFVEDSSSHPSSWQCNDCGTSHAIDMHVYQHPVLARYPNPVPESPGTELPGKKLNLILKIFALLVFWVAGWIIFIDYLPHNVHTEFIGILAPFILPALLFYDSTLTPEAWPQVIYPGIIFWLVVILIVYHHRKQ